jgi:hypothetical protein
MAHVDPYAAADGTVQLKYSAPEKVLAVSI